MAKLLQTLIPLLSSIVLLLAAANTARSQTTSFVFDFWRDQPKDLTYQGEAHFPSDSTFLRLTDALPNQVGRVLYSKRVQFWQSWGQVDFETTVKFIITPGPDNSAADGLAFFIAPVGSTIPLGSEGANLGIYDFSGNGPSVFAVEIDTYVDGAWDPLNPHVGINIGSRASRNTTAVDEADIIGQEVTMLINYKGATRMILARFSAGSKSYEIRYEYDLSNFLPQQVQVGISAATGQHVAAHDIVSWKFTSTMVQKNSVFARTRKEMAGNTIRQFV